MFARHEVLPRFSCFRDRGIECYRTAELAVNHTSPDTLVFIGARNIRPREESSGTQELCADSETWF